MLFSFSVVLLLGLYLLQGTLVIVFFFLVLLLCQAVTFPSSSPGTCSYDGMRELEVPSRLSWKMGGYVAFPGLKK